MQKIIEADLTASPIQELGHHVGASARTLSRLFNDELGMTFPVWRSQHNVSHVAGDARFSSPSAFINAYRAAFGQTPGSLYR